MWPVDSATTADLMVNFHRYRKIQELPVYEALLPAEVDALAWS
jgi:hypothetical protein